MTSVLMAAGTTLYSLLRIGFMIVEIVCNIKVLHKLLRNRIRSNICVGCSLFANICFLNTLNGFVWFGIVLCTTFPNYDERRPALFVQMVCVVESTCVQFISYFLLVNTTIICLHNVTRPGGYRLNMILSPWLLTAFLFLVPRLLSGEGAGKFSGFLKLTSLESSDGLFGADVELMMCGEQMRSDRLLIGLQYCIIVAPLAIVISVCACILAVRARTPKAAGEKTCRLDILVIARREIEHRPHNNNASFPITEKHVPLSDHQQAVVVINDNPDLSTASTIDISIDQCVHPCQYDVVKSVLGMVLLVNLIWQCCMRPFLITQNAEIGNLYFIDVGSSMLVGIQSSYLPIYTLINLPRK